MKVIRKGVNVRGVPFRGTCRSCLAKVEAERTELDIEFDHRENGELARAPCPECKNEMIFYPRAPA
jgi:hypothetical protein